MPEEAQRVIVICGPTAVGKSRVAVEVARVLDGEIISADSMQVYEGISIITDQPSPELLAAVPHYLIGFIGLDEEYSAARFTADARTAIEKISSLGRLPVIVGGTGLYIRALLGNFSFAGIDKASRRHWQEFIEEHGPEAALVQLQQLDPDTAAAIDSANPRRILRALEAAESGDPLSAERERLWSDDSPYEVISFALELPREELYTRIDLRVDAMLAGGAVEEVRQALTGGISRTAAQAIGFQEIKAYIEKTASREDTAAAIRQKSRNYAKRQLTWMRKVPDIVRIDVVAGTHEAARIIINHIKSANGTPSA